MHGTPCAFCRIYITASHSFSNSFDMRTVILYLALCKKVPLDTSDEDFNKQFDVNMKGVFNMLRLASTQLHEGGSIINLSTSVVGLKLERYGVYAATKSAVETMSAILSKELRGKNISVNCVAPGPTETDLFTEGKSQEFIDKLANMSPMERLGQPEDIANVVNFLASDEGHWVNGQVLRANGGVI